MLEDSPQEWRQAPPPGSHGREVIGISVKGLTMREFVLW